jgi:hypothetical protein
MSRVCCISRLERIRSAPKAAFLSGLLLGVGVFSLVGLARPAAAETGTNLYAYVGGSPNEPCTSPAADCDLTTALAEASSDNDGDTVYLGSSSPYYGNWTISGSLTIEPAPGQTTATLDGNGGNDSSTCTTDETCDGPVLSITAGSVDVTDIDIQNADDLQNGGTGGGGIYEDQITALTLTGDTFLDDQSDVGGGGLGTLGGTVQVTDSTFENDGAPGNPGGGIILDNVSSATISGSSFTDDEAGTDGGAIASLFSDAEISDSTFYDDTAADGYGGAIYAELGSSVVVSASTFSADSAPEGAGADIFAGSFLDSPSVWVAGDVFSDGCYVVSGEASWTDAGYNVDVGSSCATGGSSVGDVQNDTSLPSQLGALSYNGGPTETNLPLSTALQIIPASETVTLTGAPVSSVTLCPTTDQRGAMSVSGDMCYAGSVQDPNPVLSVGVSNQTIPFDQSPDLTPGYSVFILGQDPSSLGSAANCVVDELNTTTPVTKSPIRPGNYTINCSGAQNSTADTPADPNTYYSFDYVPATLTVSPPNQPVNVALPTISGSLSTGEVLMRVHGHWVSPSALTFKVQWERCDGPSSADDCVAIRGATNANHYVLQTADVGKYITVKVTATDQGGQHASATANPVGPVTSRDVKP